MDEANGVDLHVESKGQGPPLLFMHGFAGSARNFRPQIRALESRARCIAFDARGHGRSAAPEAPEAYSPAEFVKDARRVLTAECDEPAVLCGLSMGASVALAMATQKRDDLRALILASIPAGSDNREGISSRALAFADAILRDGLSAAGERFVWGENSGLDDKARMFVRQGFMEHDPRGLALTLRGVIAELPTWSREGERLASLDLPVLVIAGGEDEPSLRACEQVAMALPRAQFARIGGAGHVVNLANPRAFNEVVGGFLAGLDSAPESGRAGRNTPSESF